MTVSKKKPTSRVIEIDGIKFIPVNLETEYSLEDNNFAIDYCSEHMGSIMALNENMVAIKESNLTNETAGISLAAIYAAMANIKITSELLSLIYKRVGEDCLNSEQRDENIELFGRMRGKVNYNKAKDECLNFMSFISGITSDGMLIYTQAVDQAGVKQT